MQLRWYQQQALDAILECLAEQDINPCVELPTAAGKTPLMAALIEHCHTNYADTKIIVLAHTKELVEQGYDKLKQFWPDADAGIYAAKLRRKDTANATIFASIQSVYRKAKLFGTVDIIIVDEAHRIPLSGDGQYRRFINEVKKLNPSARVIGLTATPFRLQGGPVCGPKNILHSIIYRVGIQRLIDEGYLCRPVTHVAVQQADLANVAVRNGEYVAGGQEEAWHRDGLIRAAVHEFINAAAGRNRWLIFAATVKHAEELQAEFREQGYELPLITGDTADKDRAEDIKRYKAGDYRGLINVNVLTEGFDAPEVDCIGLFRATMSAALYYQMVGRGFRLHPSKKDFLVLDFAGNAEEHGPVDDLRSPGKKAGDGEAPIRICSKCRSVCHAAAKECPECGHIFPPAERADPVHNIVPGQAPILMQDASKWIDTHGWALNVHVKPNKKPTLRVDYNIGLQRMSEWVPLEHGGPPRLTAIQWWTDRGGARPAPRTIKEALERRSELHCPKAINVVVSGQHPRIVGYRHG